jgi:hypothetical protein
MKRTEDLTTILAAVLTFRERLRDREVLCFVDNTSALSWAVHGTVQNPEAAELAHALHLALAELGSSWFFAYVPSAANIAHIPSRACDGLRASDLRTLRELGAYRVPMVLPTVTQLQDLSARLTSEVFGPPSAKSSRSSGGRVPSAMRRDDCAAVIEPNACTKVMREMRATVDKHRLV